MAELIKDLQQGKTKDSQAHINDIIFMLIALLILIYSAVSLFQGKFSLEIQGLALLLLATFALYMYIIHK